MSKNIMNLFFPHTKRISLNHIYMYDAIKQSQEASNHYHEPLFYILVTIENLYYDLFRVQCLKLEGNYRIDISKVNLQLE
jgi:TFIIF-interacting CTD phosphatase-like protein